MTYTVRGPAGMHVMSENSHSCPEVKLVLGHAAPPSVVAFWHTPVLGLHGPSPTLPAPSKPPTQVCAVLGSLKVWPSAYVAV